MGPKELGRGNVDWIHLDIHRPAWDSCEHGNGHSGFIKGGIFLGQLNDYQHLRKDSASWF
jgi:hypothetical protein